MDRALARQFGSMFFALHHTQEMDHIMRWTKFWEQMELVHKERRSKMIYIKKNKIMQILTIVGDAFWAICGMFTKLVTKTTTRAANSLERRPHCNSEGPEESLM